MNRRGFSLIEVVFAASILAVVFMILLSIFPTAMLSVRQTEHRFVAGGIAQAILDECRSGPFSLLADDQDVDETTVGVLGDKLRRSIHRGDDGASYRATLRVGPSPTSSVPRRTLAHLQVQVTWRERGKDYTVQRSLQVASLSR